MPRKKRAASPFDLFDDVFDDDCSSKSGNPPIQRNAANARERARMRVLSSAFGRLKTKLPNIPPDTKLSKLDTLRLATMYIKQLKNLVENNGSASTSSSAENTDSSFSDDGETLLNKSRMGSQITWPFALHHLQNSNRQNPVAHLNWPTSQPNAFYKLSAYEQSPSEAAYAQPQSTNQQYNCNVGHWYREDCGSRNGPAECSYPELMPAQPMQQDHELHYNAEQFGHMQL